MDKGSPSRKFLSTFPGVVEHSPIYGNYVTASRDIAEGELIILERPLLVSPYGTRDSLQICLSCHKEVSLSEKCVKCQWPLCLNDNCANNPCHKQNECDILSLNGVTSTGLVKEYFGVETLRCLLLSKTNSTKFDRVLQFEGHSGERAENKKDKETLDFVANFIIKRCSQEIDVKILNHVVGVLSINTFWGFKELGRYSSILFDKCSLFAHDCNPNTARKLCMQSKEDSGNQQDSSDCYSDTGITIEVRAIRPIIKGDSITINYIVLEQSVQKRRSELSQVFYFDCTCSRCLQELLKILNE